TTGARSGSSSSSGSWSELLVGLAAQHRLPVVAGEASSEPGEQHRGRVEVDNKILAGRGEEDE
ncbi:unnamed protein product, partial [Amoebophrya sp. A25]